MAMTERSRSVIFQRMRTVLDDERAAEEMLSHFPARDVEEPVTKEFLRLELAEVRAEFAGLRAEFADLKGEFADLKAELAGVRAEMHLALRNLLQWLVTTMIAIATVMTAVLLAAG